MRRAAIDGVYCLSQPFALAILDAACEADRDVPRDLRVSCARDFRVSDPEAFSLTTLEFAPFDLGAAAVDLLVDVVDGTARPGVTRPVPAAQHVRASTASSSC